MKGSALGPPARLLACFWKRHKRRTGLGDGQGHVRSEEAGGRGLAIEGVRLYILVVYLSIHLQALYGTCQPLASVQRVVSLHSYDWFSAIPLRLIWPGHLVRKPTARADPRTSSSDDRQSNKQPKLPDPSGRTPYPPICSPPLRPRKMASALTTGIVSPSVKAGPSKPRQGRRNNTARST